MTKYSNVAWRQFTPGPAGAVQGQEKYTFLYVAISAVAVAFAVAFSAITGLAWKQSILVTIGCFVVAFAIVFCFMEVRRAARAAKAGAAETPVQRPNPYASRSVTVAPPTGDAYPHHEDYVESQGFDQGQLTARIPDATPFVEGFLSRLRRSKKA